MTHFQFYLSELYGYSVRSSDFELLDQADNVSSLISRIILDKKRIMIQETEVINDRYINIGPHIKPPLLYACT